MSCRRGRDRVTGQTPPEAQLELLSENLRSESGRAAKASLWQHVPVGLWGTPAGASLEPPSVSSLNFSWGAVPVPVGGPSPCPHLLHISVPADVRLRSGEEEGRS